MKMRLIYACISVLADNPRIRINHEAQAVMRRPQTPTGAKGTYPLSIDQTPLIGLKTAARGSTRTRMGGGAPRPAAAKRRLTCNTDT